MSVAAAAQKIRRSKIHQTDGYFHYEPNFTIEVIEILQMLSTNANTISYIMKIFWKTGDHIHLTDTKSCVANLMCTDHNRICVYIYGPLIYGHTVKIYWILFSFNNSSNNAYYLYYFLRLCNLIVLKAIK